MLIIPLTPDATDSEFLDGALSPGENLPLLHYMKIDYFLALLRDAKLHVSRIDTFTNDLNDGRYPAANLTSQSGATSQLYRALSAHRDKQKMIESNDIDRMFRYAHCWFEGAAETWEMWDTFGDSGQGVCIWSTSVLLWQALTPQPSTTDLLLDIRRCPYRDESEPIPELFSAASAGRKARRFASQREIRIGCCIHPDKRPLDKDGNFQIPPLVRRLDINPNRLIKQVTTGPRTSPENVKGLLCESAGLLNAALVGPSTLALDSVMTD